MLPSNLSTICQCKHAALLHADTGNHRCKVNRCKCLRFQLPASTLADRVTPASLDALLSLKHSLQAEALRRRPIIGLRGEHHTFRSALGETLILLPLQDALGDPAEDALDATLELEG